MVSGLCLLIGVVTPVSAGVILLGCIGTALSLLPNISLHLFDSSLAVIYVCVTASSVVLLGPGAYSVDARLFGRREIYIPAK